MALALVAHVQRAQRHTSLAGHNSLCYGIKYQLNLGHFLAQPSVDCGNV